MQSVEEIYKKYAKTVYQFLLSLTHDPQVAEEVTQETFYQAVKSIGRYDGSCKITTWLCAIAKNQLYAYQRKHPITEPEEVLSTHSLQASAEDVVMEQTDHVNVMKQLHLLKEPYREVLYLRLFGNLSFKDIGEVFGKSENWARVTFYRGKEMLRKELTDYES